MPESPATSHAPAESPAPAAHSLLRGADGKWRCGWAGHDPLYQHYHDCEWGIPTADSRQIFENLCLEGFQSGLSWLTILRKREALRAAFAQFDFAALAALSAESAAEQTERLMQNSGIIRHRGKIAAVFGNARAAQKVEAECGSLAVFLRRFCPATEQSAQKLARALKQRGFAFIGPASAYAFMQAMGMVNDHAQTCCCHAAAEQTQRAFWRA